MITRIKMVKNRLIVVVKLANSELLAAFYALISQFFPHFSLASHSCKALIIQNRFRFAGRRLRHEAVIGVLKSPHSVCKAARITGAAVSVRKMRGPSWMAVKPAATAWSTSSSVKPPSGPMSK